MKRCDICLRIDLIAKRENPSFVKELYTGYVVLADYQLYRGYTFFLSKIHVEELHELPNRQRTMFLQEMASVAEAVYKAFRPKKLNYELLGNSEPHLHWHLIPRYEDDPEPLSPVWILPKTVRYAEANKPLVSELDELKKALLKHL